MTEFRGKIYDGIAETIGATPLVKLKKIAEKNGCKANIIAKCEFFNPGNSVKDRLAIAMINAAEKDGSLKEGGVIIEPTSGNTGIGLAMIAAARDYRCILTMPDTMSYERRVMLRLLGADLVLTPGADGMGGAIAKAEELVTKFDNACMPQQFKNAANAEIYRTTTAVEIWEDSKGDVDMIIAGVGTGGTITGIAQYLKEKNPNIKICAVEPEESPVISGGDAGKHKIQGIGAGFIPDVLDKSLIDEVLTVQSDDAIKTMRDIAQIEGLAGGISSGAAIYAAIERGKKDDMEGKNIVVILASFAERYLSSPALIDIAG